VSYYVACTIFLLQPVGLYGCENWSLTSRAEHELRVFENRVLRRIFGLNRDEVTGDWRNMHNEELHNLFSSPIVRSSTSPAKNDRKI
jgi:hypothetical protein